MSPRGLTVRARKSYLAKTENRRMTVDNTFEHLMIACALFVVVGIVAFAGQTPRAADAGRRSADPYANNAAPGTTQFPLAAPAGKDSSARTTRAGRRREPGTVRSGDLEVRHRVQPAGRARRSGIR